MRDRGKTRLAAGRDFLDENITKESLVGKLKDLHSNHSDVEEVLKMKELCKKRGSSRKAATPEAKTGGSSKKTSSGAKTQGVAAVKGGIILTSEIVSPLHKGCNSIQGYEHSSFSHYVLFDIIIIVIKY